jgi:hypothetical protein
VLSDGLGVKCGVKCAAMRLGPGRGAGFNAATTRLLDGRAFDRAKGTEDAAVAGLGPKQDMTIGALVEEEARIDGHGFGCHEAALWTSEDRLQDRRWLHCLAPNRNEANRQPAVLGESAAAGRPR